MKIWDFFVINVIGKIKWDFIRGKKYYKMDDASLNRFREMLAKNHYIILTRRETHLTTYLIGIADFIKRGHFAYWSHAALNAEDEVTTDADFRIIEATGTGVHYSSFMEVFDCDAAVLLIPNSFTEKEWTKALTDAAQQLGKSYDTVFNILSDKKLSCIELVYHALKKSGASFPNFDNLIKQYKTITPEMLYDCKDFRVVYEVRK